jgi:DNA processing protein
MLGVSMEERSYWVVLNSVAGIGPIRFQKLLDVFGSAERAYAASAFELVDVGLDRRTIDAVNSLRQHTTPERFLTELGHKGITPVTFLDADYPENLRHVPDPPPVLFTRGELTPADAQAVALVGTRRATPYGHAVAERLATALARRGVTVVSGLAKGIDTVAHQAAVRAGGRTIAVLGNGLDQVYPAQNASLARAIVAGAGALVSEFAPGIPPDALNFPRRNRIISGLARLTVIVEAGERSGALITADFALEQGRDVLAVPGAIFSPTSAGANRLIKQGAPPVTSVKDILDALVVPSADEVARPLPSNLGENEAQVYGALDDEPRHVNDLSSRLAMPAGIVSATLTVLELRELARQAGPMLYTRA